MVTRTEESIDSAFHLRHRGWTCDTNMWLDHGDHRDKGHCDQHW